MSGAETATTAVTHITPADVKYLVWMVGTFVGVLCAGAVAAWWFSRQQSMTKRELYTKINYVQRDVNAKVDSNNESCLKTKERLGLLEQSHGHLEKRIEGIDEKLVTMQADISSTKESINTLSNKQSEQHLLVVGEVRSLGDKILIDRLQKQQQLQS